MLVRMLAAINLPLEEVYITNVLKCSVAADVQPREEYVNACMSYLQRQISATSPELICTMGTLAARTLLRQPHSLSKLRGQFHTYLTTDGVNIPLLSTYHPEYLLKNPEMKNATWEDLQEIQKRL